MPRRVHNIDDLRYLEVDQEAVAGQKIIIVKGQGWYTDLAGKVFEVTDAKRGNGEYVQVQDGAHSNYIHRSDYRVLSLLINEVEKRRLSELEEGQRVLFDMVDKLKNASETNSTNSKKEIKNEQQTDSIASICDELRDLLIRKDRDYGSSFSKQYDEFGIISSLMRISDKVNRLKTLVKTGAENAQVDESIDDTLLDLSGYAIMTLVERRNYNQND